MNNHRLEKEANNVRNDVDTVIVHLVAEVEELEEKIKELEKTIEDLNEKVDQVEHTIHELKNIE